MISIEDLTDIVVDSLIRPAGPENAPHPTPRQSADGKPGKRGFHVKEIFNKPYTSLRSAKNFLSEYDVKQLAKDGGAEAMKILRIPKTSIVSPLAQEWLDRKGIRTVKDGD